MTGIRSFGAKSEVILSCSGILVSFSPTVVNIGASLIVFVTLIGIDCSELWEISSFLEPGSSDIGYASENGDNLLQPVGALYTISLGVRIISQCWKYF